MMMSAFVAITWNPAFKEFFIFVCSFSWILTVMQGFDGFWKLYKYYVSLYLRRYAARRTEALQLVGNTDNNGHVITAWDVARLKVFLGNQLVELFAQDLGISSRSTSSDSTWFVPCVEHLQAVYSASTIITTALVALLLIFQSAETSCAVFNCIICFIIALPIIYLAAWLVRFTQYTVSTLSTSMLKDKAAAMRLWENSKRSI